jgi:hypothetical protein
MYSKLKVLLLLAEFPFWRAARHLSYSVQLGIEDGLHANGVQCQTVTSLWLPKVLDLWSTRKFDQVWVAGRLDLFDEVSLQRLLTMAPVRLGMLAESLEYSAEECRISPTLKNRTRIVERRLQYMTHTLACDEKDVSSINANGDLSAIWWPQAVPSRFISEAVVSPSQNRGVFFGAVYGIRREWLRRPELKQVLAHPKSPETGSIYPLLFDALHLPLVRPFRFVLPMKEQGLNLYLSRLRSMRERCFECWLKALQTGCAVVNLPHFVKTYAGRVVEGMAAGRPVISWEIPGRPQNKALFEDEREILLYAGDDPYQLASQLNRVLTDPDLGRRVVLNARKKILRFHTSEIRVCQILDWITKGQAPVYS